MASACRDGDGDLSPSTWTRHRTVHRRSAARRGPRRAPASATSSHRVPLILTRETLRFSVANQPDWLGFDRANGRLTGTPAPATVGRFSGVTISVTDGITQKTLEPFTIRVEGVSATRRATPPVTAARRCRPPAGRSASPRYPEIVFVRGYRESEHLGIFHLDTRNRWTPGDLDNESGWKPRVATELEVIDGGLRRRRATTPRPASCSYDGTGKGTADRTRPARRRRRKPSARRSSTSACCSRPSPGASAPHALSRHRPRLRDALRGRRCSAACSVGAPYDAPNVLLVTPGTYAEDFYLKRGLRNLYVIGEPGIAADAGARQPQPRRPRDRLSEESRARRHDGQHEQQPGGPRRSTSTSRRCTSTTRRATPTASRRRPASPAAERQLALLVLELPRLADGLAGQPAPPDVHRGSPGLAAAHQQHPHHGLEAVQHHQVDAIVRHASATAT